MAFSPALLDAVAREPEVTLTTRGRTTGKSHRVTLWITTEVRPRHVDDAEEARATSHLARKKYGTYVKPSQPGQPLTRGEQAVFELLPVS